MLKTGWILWRGDCFHAVDYLTRAYKGVIGRYHDTLSALLRSTLAAAPPSLLHPAAPALPPPPFHDPHNTKTQPRWDSFMRLLDPVASRLPWMVAAGNHEIETNGAYPGTKPFVAYEHRFRMPAAAESPANLEYGCGVGGGLDGDGMICGEGYGAEEADAAAENEVATQLMAGLQGDRVPAGDEVGAAVRRASRETRKAFDPIGGAAAGVLMERGEDADEKPVSCCPSEWSGTYDFGNRCGTAFMGLLCVCECVCFLFFSPSRREEGWRG